jgi:hypothetical protein
VTKRQLDIGTRPHEGVATLWDTAADKMLT